MISAAEDIDTVPKRTAAVGLTCLVKSRYFHPRVIIDLVDFNRSRVGATSKENSLIFVVGEGCLSPWPVSWVTQLSLLYIRVTGQV